MSELDELRSEVIALRALVIRDLRREQADNNNDSNWQKKLNFELTGTLAMLELPSASEFAIKGKALEIINEALFGKRPQT